MDRIKVVQYGLGPIGLSIVEFLLTRPWVQLVGVVDIDRTKVGKDVGQLLLHPRNTGVVVSGRVGDVLKSAAPAVITHATSSYMTTIQPQLLEILENGISVVSTSEELAYPFAKHADLAKDLDKCARENNAVVLGTGVNPGFVLDTLAVVLSGICQNVNSIRAERIVDASNRRAQLQKKIGVGMSPPEFEKRVADGGIKHVGLPESVGLISLGMGWKLGEVQERITPVIAEKQVSSDEVTVQPGAVAGVRQVAKGILGGQELVVLDLRMYIRAPNPHDSILIDGTPLIDMTIRGGVHGDIATPAIMVNCIPRLKDLEPGLRTMLDLPPLSPRFDLQTGDRSVMLKTF